MYKKIKLGNGWSKVDISGYQEEKKNMADFYI